MPALAGSSAAATKPTPAVVVELVRNAPPLTESAKARIAALLGATR